MSTPGRGAQPPSPCVPARRQFQHGGPPWSSHNPSRKTGVPNLGGHRGLSSLFPVSPGGVYWRDSAPLKVLPCPEFGEAVMSDLLKSPPFRASCSDGLVEVRAPHSDKAPQAAAPNKLPITRG